MPLKVEFLFDFGSRTLTWRSWSFPESNGAPA